jgi:hypothetical protein
MANPIPGLPGLDPIYKRVPPLAVAQRKHRQPVFWAERSRCCAITRAAALSKGAIAQLTDRKPRAD